MLFEGKITLIGDQSEVGQNGLQKITFVLEENTEKEFKSSIAIDLLGDKTDLIKAYNVGDIVKASLNFKSNEYNGKWYNRISAWKIEGVNGGESKETTNGSGQSDDLPF